MNPKEIYERRKKLFIEYGLSLDDYDKWKYKFHNLKRSAAQYGRKRKLTFDEYLLLAHQAGITRASEIGTEDHQYQMGRIGDMGDYELGNCRFITALENRNEQDKTKCGRPGSLSRPGEKYKSRSPDGIIYEFENLSEFCRLNDLNQGNMSGVLSGKKPHHKGWTSAN